MTSHRAAAERPAAAGRGLRAWGLLLGLPVLASALPACTLWDTNIEPPPSFVWEGRRPIYFVGEDGETVVALPPRDLVQGGGLVVVGNLLYVVDVGTGVHVFDNSDPSREVPLSFIQIYGVNTITVAGSRLYANNFTDLVTVDVSDPREVRLLDRDPGFYAEVIQYPIDYFGYFECYEPERGRLVSWEAADLENPQCRTF